MQRTATIIAPENEPSEPRGREGKGGGGQRQLRAFGFWAEHMGMTKLGVKSCLLMSRIAHAIIKIPRKGTEEREFGSLGFGQKYT